MDNPLRPLVSAWLSKIRLAQGFKKKKFQDDADEAMFFFHGPYDDMYGIRRGSMGRGFVVSADTDDLPKPTFRMTVNKVAEMVQLFGPALYHKNPIRQVNPRNQPGIPPEMFGDPNDPNVQMQYQQMAGQEQQTHTVDSVRAMLLQTYLNWTPTALDLKTESRWAIDEAIIKGAGCLSGGTEIYAKIDGRHSVLRVRDLERMNIGITSVDLWDGEAWNRVIGVRKKPREGGELKLILRSGEQVNCTADHGWPTHRGLLRADELMVGDRLSYVGLPDSEAVGGEHLPDDIGWFVGLYLGDGHIPAGKHDVAIGIAGHIDETTTQARLDALVKAYGGTITWKTMPGTKKKDAIIYSRILVAILREYIANDGAYKKHLRTSCWERSTSFLRSLLEGYLDADGHWVAAEDAWRVHFCRNKALAHDLRTLCARLGLKIFLRLIKEGDRVNYLGRIPTRPPKINNAADPGLIVKIQPADWRCDFYYDIAVEKAPHTYALASGLSTHNCLWTELYYPSGANGTKMVGSFFDTVDNLLYDPDAESDREAKWVAKRCIHPVWQVEEEYGLPPGTLKGNLESYNQQASTSANKDGDYDRKRGLTNDLLVYWKVFSKMGMGARLSGQANGSQDADPSGLRQTLDQLGKFCYLVVADGVEYPLNLPQQAIELAGDDEIHQRIQWPTPFWADDTWPFTLIAFHKVPREIWPMSHLKPGIGELKAINWIYSMLANKVRIACRDFLAIAKSAGEEIKDQIRVGDDYTILEIEAIHGEIDKIVKFLQHPEFHPGIIEVLKLLEMNFEKRVGLTELMYGLSAKQLRSATEANDKQNNATIRPDDMANKVEDAMGEVARKEALACRWHLDQNDVAPILGPMGAQMWAQVVMPSDPSEVIHQLEYRIEAGSAKKPNKDRDAQNMGQAIQTLFQPLFQVAMQTGNIGPFNALVSDWAKSLDLEASKYLLPPPPPPPQQGPPPGPPQKGPAGAPPIHIHNHAAPAPR